MDDKFYTIFLEFGNKINSLILQFELISKSLDKIEINEIKTIENNTDTLKEITNQNLILKENINELKNDYSNLTENVLKKITDVIQNCEKCAVLNGYKSLSKRLWSICVFLFIILLFVLGLNLFNFVKLPGLLK